jgi:hypothetical protein
MEESTISRVIQDIQKKCQDCDRADAVEAPEAISDEDDPLRGI